jgi:hypothetical protein
MDPLKFRTEKELQGPLRIFLDGPIDERANFESAPRVEENVALNLMGITRMNSMGLTRWVKWIFFLSEKHAVSVEAVSYPCVMQANCVANFFGKATVHSCMAPYFCSSCNASRLEEVTHEEVTRTDGLPPERSCSSCGTRLDFDELDHYFRVLQRGR